MKTVGKIVLAGIILLVLVIGGCAVLIGGAADEMEKEHDRTAITHDEFKSVKKNATREKLEERFGEPSDVQEHEIDGMESTCVYYGVKGGDVMDDYQFCFGDNGKLESKSKW